MPYLPTSSWLEPVVCIIVGYILVDGGKVQLVFLSGHDRLRDHLSIAEVRFNVLVLVFAQVHVVLVYDHGTRRADRR